VAKLRQVEVLVSQGQSGAEAIRLTREVVRQWTTRSGASREKSTMIWAPIPVVIQMHGLLQDATGKQMRRLEEYGLCGPP